MEIGKQSPVFFLRRKYIKENTEILLLNLNKVDKAKENYKFVINQ